MFKHSEIPNGIAIGDWKVTVTKGTILNAGEIEKWTQELDLQLPEMVFGSSSLRLEHASGCSLELNARDALNVVEKHTDPMKVAYSEKWQKDREGCAEKVKDVVKPFDWTYTTDYRGTVCGGERAKTEDKINVELLKRPDPILFFEELILFEDELADNGAAVLSAKVRVMPTSIFVLQRFYLRVDDVLVRVRDTRIHQELAKPWCLIEYSSRERSFPDLWKEYPDEMQQELAYKSPNEMPALLPITFECREKVTWS